MTVASTLNLGNLLVHLRADETQFLRALANAETRMRATAAKLTAIGRTMSMYVTAPMVAMGLVATKSFASFDDAMTKSLAIMKDITPELRSEMEKVAVDISKKTVTSATDLAKAYFYLASAGLSAKQSLAALPAVNELAIAGSFNLSRAVEMAAGAQKALGLSSENPIKNLRNLTRVTDVLVKSNVLAQATTSEFAEALATESAAAMKIWGIELEEGVAVLAAYASQMMKGSEAGSAFGRFLRLTMMGYRGQTEEWKKLGLTIFDTAGKLKPLADIVGDLSNVLMPMSSEMKGITLELLGFQARSQQAVLPLLGMQDAIRGYRTELRNASGYSKMVAEKNMQSFSAQVIIAWRNVEELGRNIGRTLAPYIIKLSKHVKSLTELWESLNDSVKQNIVFYGLYVASIGPILIASGLLLKTFVFMITTVKTLITWFAGLSVAMSLPLVHILALVAIAYLLRAAWLQAGEQIRKNMEGLLQGLADTWQQFSDTVLYEVFDYMVRGFQEAFQNIRVNWKYFLADLAGTAMGAKAWMFVMAEEMKNLWNDTWVTPTQAIERMKKASKEANVAFRTAFVDMWDKAPKGDKLVERFKAVTITVQAFGVETVENLKDLMRAVEVQFGKDADAVISLIKDKIKTLQNIEIPEMPISLHEQLRQILIEQEKAAEEINKEIEKLVSNTKGVVKSMSEGERAIKRMLAELDSELSIQGLINEERERAVRLEEFKEIVSKEYVDDLEKQLELISLYGEKLDVLIQGRQGFMAFSTQMKQWASDAKNVWQGVGEVATQAFDDMARSLSTMLMRGKVDFKAFARAIIGDLITIIIRAQMAQVAMSLFPSLFVGAPVGAASAGTSNTGMSAESSAYWQNVRTGYASGGIAWQPQIASLAESEPELITPFSQLKNIMGGGNQPIQVHLHNEGTNQTITKTEAYLISDQRILDVWTKDAINRGRGTNRVVRQIAGTK